MRVANLYETNFTLTDVAPPPLLPTTSHTQTPIYLVFMAGSLAVLSEGDEGLGDKVNIALIDVEAEETQTTRCAAADTVQELQRLTHQVVLGVPLLP